MHGLMKSFRRKDGATVIREGLAKIPRVTSAASMIRNPDFYACGVDLVGPSNVETLSVEALTESNRAGSTMQVLEGSVDVQALR